MNPAAALRRRDLGKLCVRRDLGKIDGELQVKMGEGVLDKPGHLAPFGLQWRIIEVQLSPISFGPR